MLRLVWTTDLHLHDAPAETRERWIRLVANQPCDGVLISGDIAEGEHVTEWLHSIAESLTVPVYFVLGNHDFYDASISLVRQRITRMCRDNLGLKYLTDCSAIELVDTADSEHPHTCLIGEDGWGDATEGNYEKSYVELQDFIRIGEFNSDKPSQWKETLQALGSHSAERLAAKLDAIPDQVNQILIVTHVPPFVESCWYEGQTADENWAPFFVCGQVGHVLKEFAKSNPNRQLTVLCGHTHHHGIAKPMSNLIVHTGGSEIGTPSIVATVCIDERRVFIEPFDETHAAQSS